MILLSNQPKILNFGPAVSEYADSVADVKDNLSQLRRAKKMGEEKVEQTETALKNANLALANIQASKSSAEITFGELTTSKDRIEALLKLCEVQLATTETLKTSVADYQGDFDKFKVALDGRNASLKSQEDVLTKLNASSTKTTAEISANHAEIERLLSEADKLLVGATNAALATEYNKRAVKLDSMVDGAAYVFYACVALMLVCSVPVFLYFVPGLYPQINSLHENVNIKSWWDTVLFVGIVLGPSVWAARFANNRHTTLFSLREMYAHKSALAASLEGFRKQVHEDNQEEVTMTTFRNIAESPEKVLSSIEHPGFLGFCVNVASHLMSGDGFKTKAFKKDPVLPNPAGEAK